MVTSDMISKATMPVQNAQVLRLPSEFDGIKAVRMNDHNQLNVKAKKGLQAEWKARPTGSHSHPYDIEYGVLLRNKWRVAKDTDIEDTEVVFDTDKQAYFYGDLILMVIPMELSLGYRKASLEAANGRVGVFLEGTRNKTAELAAQNGGSNAEMRQAPESQFSLKQVQVGITPNQK
jgi:hypothetical protein